jgi:serine/threonine protein kinase
MAPEMLQAGKMSRAADVYSFAMIMVELFTCKRLFEGLAQQQARPLPLRCCWPPTVHALSPARDCHAFLSGSGRKSCGESRSLR